MRAFLWPLTHRGYQVPLPFSRNPAFSANLELTLFGLFIFVYIITKDYARGSNTDTAKLVALIPLTALLVPMVFKFPDHVPLRLITPHLILLAVVLQPFYPTSWTRALEKL